MYADIANDLRDRVNKEIEEYVKKHDDLDYWDMKEAILKHCCDDEALMVSVVIDSWWGVD